LKIYFGSADCGAGKTHAAREYIKGIVDTKNALYVAPSLQLLSETSRELGSMGVGCRLITHETHPGRVTTAIVDALRTAPEAGCVLCITRQAFVELPFFPKRHLWQLIVDEIPQIDHLYPFQVPYSRQYIREHIELDHSVNERLALVKPIDAGKLRWSEPLEFIHE
jgi:hypothetical protein